MEYSQPIKAKCIYQKNWKPTSNIVFIILLHDKNKSHITMYCVQPDSLNLYYTIYNRFLFYPGEITFANKIPQIFDLPMVTKTSPWDSMVSFFKKETFL